MLSALFALAVAATEVKIPAPQPTAQIEVSKDQAPVAPPTEITQGEPSATLPQPPVITNPDWLKKPGPDELATLFPVGASEARVPGKVVIACAIDAQGDLQGCRVDSEEPKGWGFGEAALKAAGYFRMKPAMLDGRPVETSGIRIPLTFSLWVPAATVPPTVDEALACYGASAVYAASHPDEHWAMADAALLAKDAGVAMARDGQGTPIDLERRLARERAAASKFPPEAVEKQARGCAERMQATFASEQ